MNTQYRQEHTWTHDGAQVELWQKKLKGEKLGSHRYSQFCDVRVLCLRGMMSWNVFQAFNKLSHGQQVKVLANCISLKATVCHTWTSCAKQQHVMTVVVSVLQLLALVSWALTLRADYESDENWVALFWSIFAAAATYEVLEGVCIRIGHWRLSNDTRCRKAYAILSFSNLITWSANILAISLAAVTLGDPHCTSSYLCQLPMGLTQCVAWFKVLYHLRSVHTIGYVLIPILDAMSTRAMRGMTAIIGFCLVAFAFSCAAIMPEYTLKEMFLRSYYFLVIGEPDLFDYQDYDDFMWRYITVFLTFFVFTVLLMNVFIAITSESYQSRSQLVEGSFLVERKGLCEKALLLRKLMFKLGKRTNLTSRLHWMVVTTIVLFALFFVVRLSIADPHYQVCSLFFFPLLALACLAKLQTVWWKRPFVKQDNKEFLWVCTPQSKGLGAETDVLLGKITELLDSRAKSMNAAPDIQSPRDSSTGEGLRRSITSETGELPQVDNRRVSSKKSEEQMFRETPELECLKLNVSQIEQNQQVLQTSMNQVLQHLAHISAALPGAHPSFEQSPPCIPDLLSRQMSAAAAASEQRKADCASGPLLPAAAFNERGSTFAGSSACIASCSGADATLPARPPPPMQRPPPPPSTPPPPLTPAPMASPRMAPPPLSARPLTSPPVASLLMPNVWPLQDAHPSTCNGPEYRG